MNKLDKFRKEHKSDQCEDLINSNKVSSQMKRATQRSICCAHYNKRFDISNREHFGELLMAEGMKRVPAFIFEYKFISQLEEYCRRTSQLMTKGWAFQFKKVIEFSSREFKNPRIDIRILCQKISDAGYAIGEINADINTVSWLNEVISLPSLYEKIINKNQQLLLTCQIYDLVKKTESWRRESSRELTSGEKTEIRRLNRLLVEVIYPQETPMGEVPKYWFRLEHHHNRWNDFDDEIAKYLKSRNSIVTRVNFDKEMYNAILYGENKSRALPIDVFVKEKLGLGNAVEPKNPDNSGIDNAVLEAIDKLPPEEIESLAISRIFMNCWLFPLFARQPSDLDCFIKVEGEIVPVEFKRKYPTADDRFGLDINPFVKLIEWLSRDNKPLLHVILVDPRQGDKLSPIPLIQDKKLADNLLWITSKIVTETIRRSKKDSDDCFETSGVDSGRDSYRRVQEPLNPEEFMIIGTGNTYHAEKLFGKIDGDKSIMDEVAKRRKNILR